MAKDNDKTAYIGIEREENSLKHIAKVFGKPPFEINKAQYNAIVKEPGSQDWANTTEGEAIIISRIISSNLETSSSDEL
jgi:hypothetical protein